MGTVALPDGFVDTGVTASYSLSGEMRCRGYGQADGFDRAEGTLLGYTLYGAHGIEFFPDTETGPTPPSLISRVFLKHELEGEQRDPDTPDCFGAYSWECSLPYHEDSLGEGTEETDAIFCPWLTVTFDAGPIRLGVRWSLQDTSSDLTVPPLYARKHAIVEYGWFSDRDTKYVWTATGDGFIDADHASITRWFWPGNHLGETQYEGLATPSGGVGGYAPPLGFTGFAPVIDAYALWDTSVEFRNLSIQGVPVDFSDLYPGYGAGEPWATNCGIGHADCVVSEKDTWLCRGSGNRVDIGDFYVDPNTCTRSRRNGFPPQWGGRPFYEFIGTGLSWSYSLEVTPWGALPEKFQGGPDTANVKILDGWLTSNSTNCAGEQMLPYEETLANPTEREFSTTGSKSWDIATTQKGPPSFLSFSVRVEPDNLADVLELPKMVERIDDNGNPYQVVNPKVGGDAGMYLVLNPPRSLGVGGEPNGVGSGSYFQPITVSLAPTIEVNRPDRNRPSDWVSQDPHLTVNETTDYTEITITDSGNADKQIVRDLKTNWRNYVDFSGEEIGETSEGNPCKEDAPNFSIEGYKILKHNYMSPLSSQVVYPEDVWWWNTYRYMWIEIDSPTDCTIELRADWTKIDLDDDHKSGCDRKYYMEESYEEFSGAHSWTINVKEGLYLYEIDLLFPNGGGPKYLGRIDRLTISKLPKAPTGEIYNFKLKKLTLQARTQRLINPITELQDVWGESTTSTPTMPNNTIKVGFGVMERRFDYGVLMISVEGSQVFGELMDQAYKREEIGAYGGSPRYIEPSESRTSGIITDTTLSVTAFWSQVGLVEGLSYAFNQGVWDTYMKDDTVDSETVVPGSIFRTTATTGPVEISTLLADCTLEEPPWQSFNDDFTFKPKIALIAQTCNTVPIEGFGVRAEKHYWGAVEAIVTSGNSHAGKLDPRPQMQIYRADNNYVYDTQTVDENGYVRFSPVLGNDEKELRIEQV